MFWFAMDGLQAETKTINFTGIGREGKFNIMVEFNVIQASILEGWLFHPHGRNSRFGAKSPAPLYDRSSNDFAITYGN